MILFKYLSPEAVTKVLGTPKIVSLRFNLPSNYNDPYELFLAPDEPLDSTEEKAYYEFFVREMPQAPVTCFSRRPESVVMWAHYCREATGICLAVCEEKLVNQFDVAYIHDIDYSNEPSNIPSGVIRYAAATQKNRHTQRVLELANRAAYFSKRSDWDYEQERRLVVPNDSVENVNGILLANLPSECVTSVIIGPNTSSELFGICEAWSSQSNVNLLRMHYSKRRFEPYFTSANETLYWVEGEFKTIPYTCFECGEPIDAEQGDLCELCQVTDADRSNAAIGNQFVMCLKLGLTPGIPFVFDGLSPRGKHFTRNNQDET